MSDERRKAAEEYANGACHEHSLGSTPTWWWTDAVKDHIAGQECGLQRERAQIVARLRRFAASCDAFHSYMGGMIRAEAEKIDRGDH